MERLNNGQVKQLGRDDSPAEGGDGYVGGNSNASSLGLDVVTGKKGYTEDRPLWSTQTDSQQDDAAPATANEGSDSTDENATYKNVQTDEGLPQTFRTSSGAGDAGTAGSDEPESFGVDPSKTDLNTQTVGSELPRTKFTDVEGGGAPLFKRGA